MVKKGAVLSIGAAIIIVASFVVYARSKHQKDSVTIGFMGDVMLGRLVNEVIGKKGYAYPWGTMLHELTATDVNIINLETTLTTSKDMVEKVFNYKADPDKVETLQKARIDIVNLANNHILDFNLSGLAETIKTLEKSGIKHVGAGINIDEARKPVIISCNDITIGVIGYTDNEPGWYADVEKPGVNYIAVGDIQKVQNDIATLKNVVDILIVSIHWGPNMRQHPTQEFINFAHAMIDSGVDIIHGHSAHIFQGIELYNNGLILYDTGDFVDDYAVDPLLRNDQSFLFQITVAKDGIQKVKLTPVLISNMQVNRADPRESRQIIRRIQKLSDQFGTKIADDGIVIVSID